MKTISVDELAKLLDQNQVIDVREDDEFRAGHIAGTTSLPMSRFPENYTAILDGRPLYVICQAGGRSARVVDYLERQGIEATNVAEGVSGWAERGLPIRTGV